MRDPERHRKRPYEHLWGNTRFPGQSQNFRSHESVIARPFEDMCARQEWECRHRLAMENVIDEFPIGSPKKINGLSCVNNERDQVAKKSWTTAHVSVR